MNINIGSYDKICDDWHNFRSRTAINKCIVDFAKRLKSNGHILDVGCGTGFPIAKFLSDSGFYVTGIDVSEKMIDKAKSLNLINAEFIKIDVLDFCADKKFDGVIAFDSLWHIELSRQPEIYKKIADMTNDGGYFLFTHGRYTGEITGHMFGEKFYYSALDAEKVNALLAKAGFETIYFIENYKEKSTGDRDLLIVAQKIL